MMLIATETAILARLAQELIAATVDGIDPTAEHLAEFVAYVQSAQQQGKLRALDFVGLKWLLQNRPAA